MNYELIKKEIVKLKKEELNYIDNVAKISSNKILSEYEKLEIYRTLNCYQEKLKEKYNVLFAEIIKLKQLTFENLDDEIIEFEIDKTFLSSVSFRHEKYKEYELQKLGIDAKDLKFKLTLRDLKYKCTEYTKIETNIIQNNQRLIENPIYIFCGYYDYSEDCYGPCFGTLNDYFHAIYENICSSAYTKDTKEVPKKRMDEFEKNKIIIRSKTYVYANEIREIFEEELLNIKNKTINDCVIETNKRIEELNYIKSPEYKEKVLLEKINQLYKKVKGEFIQDELLYSSEFFDILREVYKFPNETIVNQEKILKKDRKNSVIVIATNKDKKYIIAFQNKVKDKITAEFPLIYVGNDEDVISATKNKLRKETGYTTDDLFIVDYDYTLPGVDNSVTYIVIANNCIKTEENISNNDYINYGLFSEEELEYLINNNIIKGFTNKFAYYIKDKKHIKSNKK